MRPLLPPSLLDLLAPSFDHARRTLEALGGGLSGKLRIVAPGPPLRPPTADPQVVPTWTEALFRGRRLRLHYQKRGESAPVEAVVDPLGLVLRGASLVLVALGRGERPIHYLAHRCAEATMLDEPARPLPGFDLGSHAEGGAFGYVFDPIPVRLVVDFEPGAANAAIEAPLSVDQVARTLPDGRVRVTASVVDSRSLRVWLMGFGPEGCVIEPETMRRQVASDVEKMWRRYGGGRAGT